MMASKKAKGKRAKTRRKMKRRGPSLTVSGFLRKPEVNARVLINIDSSVHSGIPSMRYQGKTGVVRSVKKNSVEVAVGRTGKEKTLVVHSCHLTVLGGGSK